MDTIEAVPSRFNRLEQPQPPQRFARRILRDVVRMALANRVLAHLSTDPFQPADAERNTLRTWQDGHREVRVETLETTASQSQTLAFTRKFKFRRVVHDQA